MRRVYVRKAVTEYDPRIIAPSCLYLASKAEESTVQAKLLVSYIKKNFPDEKFMLEIKDTLEMEMKILEALNFYLVVFHPYRSLSELLQDADMNDATQLTWGLVNDTYKIDLILKYYPHLIALACVYIASVLTNKENAAWFEELRVDMNTDAVVVVVIITDLSWLKHANFYHKLFRGKVLLHSRRSLDSRIGGAKRFGVLGFGLCHINPYWTASFRGLIYV